MDKAKGGMLTAVVLCALSLSLTAASPAVDAAFSQFFEAKDSAAAANAAGAVVKSAVGFDDAFDRLKRGRSYSADVPRGVVRLTNRQNGASFAYMLDVPETYDPAKKYQVRVQLHGGVGRPDPTPRGNGIGSLAGIEQIYVLPTAWEGEEWWRNSQVENLRTILDRLKRTYNVDENLVVLSGVSDGGTGTYYVSMRDTTPFASFLPLNGALAVLRSSNVDTEGEMFLNNCLNKPFFIVNGGRDPLYPTSLVGPYIEQMKTGGVEVRYLPQPDAVHNTAWWPNVKDTYEMFVHEHPRVPLPDRLTWEADLTAGTGRAHWLVIDALSKNGPDAPRLADVNDVAQAPDEDFGMEATGSRVTAVTRGGNAAAFGLQPGDLIAQIGTAALPAGADIRNVLATYAVGAPMTITVLRGTASMDLKGTYNPVLTPRVVPLFRHVWPSGRVDLVRDGNTITATTRRVSAFTLLLSPDAIDFSKPVKVVADGKVVFDGPVTKSVATLMKWAARDNDRTLLFGAEVTVKLPE